MMRTRTWLLLSGALGVHLFVPGSQGPDSWWTDVGALASIAMLLAAVRHPRLADHSPADHEVVVLDVEPNGRPRVLALLGHRDPWGSPALANVRAEPWTVVSGLTERRARQVVAYLHGFGVDADWNDDSRVRTHLGLLRATPIALGLAAVLVHGPGGPTGELPPALAVLALVAAWLTAVATAYVVVDVVAYGRPRRPSDWQPDFEVTGPYDVELVSLPDGRRIDAVKAMRTVLDVDLDEATRLVRAELPTVVHAGLSRVEAERLAFAVNAVGGTAVVRRAEREPEPF